MKFSTKYDIVYLTLGPLLQYLGKLKIQISADIQPIAYERKCKQIVF